LAIDGSDTGIPEPINRQEKKDEEIEVVQSFIGADVCCIADGSSGSND
jgi:hypothetical protein